MDYVPHDEKVVRDMLKIIGVDTLKDLYKDIPAEIQLDKLNLPNGLSEAAILKELTKLSNKNHIYSASFLGAGCYYHYIPTLVDFVISRSEFYTSYTPYQAEASQGFLQAIFEYQSAISRLTEMDVANASMYDGSTALAEAAIMASTINRKNKILMIEGIHPEYVEVVKTYCWGREIEVEMITIDNLEASISDEYAGLLFQSPNFFGDIEDIEAITKIVRNKTKKCLIIQCMTDPTCLGYLIAPGKTDIDIFVAEGQALGISPSFGGPSLGIFTSKQKLIRKMPGRLIGLTKEEHGDKEGFVLTLQAREQHIRREKALSNICSNQSLCMLAALVYLVSLGKTGLREVAKQNFQKTYYLKDKLSKIPGYQILNTKPTYNEFLLGCPKIDILVQKCKDNDLLPPLKLSNYYPERENIALICVTEVVSKEEMDKFVELAKEAAQ